MIQTQSGRDQLEKQDHHAFPSTRCQFRIRASTVHVPTFALGVVLLLLVGSLSGVGFCFVVILQLFLFTRSQCCGFDDFVCGLGRHGGYCDFVGTRLEGLEG